jgi:ribonuclease HI
MCLLLLRPGDDEIDLYSDGSHRPDLQIGGWAYCVPALGLEMAAVEVGSSVEWFELAGVVEGIEGISGMEHSARPIHIHTDSAYVSCLLKHLIAGQPYRSRRSFERVMDLIRRVAGPCGQRNLRCSRTQRQNPLIRNCHLAVTRKVREHVATDPILSHQLAFKREENRLSALSAEREKLGRRLENLEEELRLCRVRVSVLSMTAQPDRPETNHNVRDLLGNPSSKQVECAAENVLVAPKNDSPADAAGLCQAEI